MWWWLEAAGAEVSLFISELDVVGVLGEAELDVVSALCVDGGGLVGVSFVVGVGESGFEACGLCSGEVGMVEGEVR